jgi:hypothetical protein
MRWLVSSFRFFTFASLRLQREAMGGLDPYMEERLLSSVRATMAQQAQHSEEQFYMEYLRHGALG